MNNTLKKIIRKKDRKQGFTLVELLVASSILISALGAPLYVGVQGVIIATESKSKITATFLAEEGIELMRNVRDTNILTKISNPASTITWNSGFSSSSDCLVVSGTNVGCTIGRNLDDFLNPVNVPRACGPVSCPALQKKVVGDEDLYGYASGATDSFFNRTIKVSPVGSSPDELKIESIVTWTTRGTTKTVQIEEHLFSYGFP